VHQYEYEEQGGLSLDMLIFARDFDLLLPEGGLGFSVCSNICAVPVFVDASVGYSQECRFLGNHMEARFVSDPYCHIKLKGLYPQKGFWIPRVNIGMKSDLFFWHLFLQGTLGLCVEYHRDRPRAWLKLLKGI